MKKVINLFALLLICNWCNAQVPSVTDATVTMHTTGTAGILSCNYTVVLSDTSGVSDIEIKIGSTSGTDDLLTQNVGYDNAGSLPGGWTYSRVSNTITIGAGTLTEQNIYFCSVRLKSSGTWGTSYEFITN